MMKNSTLFAALLVIFISSCNLPKDKEKVKLSIIPQEYATHFSDSLDLKINTIIETSDSSKQAALTFLYRYMPLNDKLDYPVELFSDIVDISLEIRKETKWGNSIPDILWNHFVLPHRTNNEKLDTSRIFFYHQIFPRVKNLSMLEAALEVNHWCHEHVAYQASDGRTSSALDTYFKGYGRCGEESVFTVNALRSVGIPARQVYTPRWAHTDDNHAWVEFWADGKWYYYGACEPEAEANMGWFTEPARRAMLVGARVYGPYDGEENILKISSVNSSTNSLSVYAQTKKMNVLVKNKSGMVLPHVKVDFQLYNYAEFYTLFQTKTNNQGIASFETGIGDVLVWASTDSSFAYQMQRNNTLDTLILTLDALDKKEFQVDLKYNPPIKPEPIIVDQTKNAQNQIRLAYEDSLRKAYENTFLDSATISKHALENNVDAVKLWDFIKKSRANGNQISLFIQNAPSNLKSRAMDILESISLKDLQDAKYDLLLSHLLYSIPKSELADLPEDIFIKYILNPRITSEDLSLWRKELHHVLGSDANPIAYFDFVKTEIHLNDTMNFSGVQISPASVFKYKIADAYSRDILLIALWRSNGIPARLEAGTELPQYYAEDEWHTLTFEQATEKSNISTAYLHLIDKSAEANLEYYKHFTIAKLENGIFNTLTFEENKLIKNFPQKISLSAGYYRLCTGKRLADGSVNVQFKYFQLNENETKSVEVNLNESTEAITIFGKLKEVNQLQLSQTKNACTISNQSYKVLVWFRPNNEPSKHALEDISKVKVQLNSLNADLFLIGEKNYQPKELDTKYFGNLPKSAQYVMDTDLQLLEKVKTSSKTNFGNEFPYIVVLTPDDEIIYLSEAYKIGVGDEIRDIIQRHLNKLN